MASMSQDNDLATLVQRVGHFDPTPLASFGVSLEVEAGPDTGATFELIPTDPMPVLVGQSTVCAFRIADPAVSRRHFSLELRPPLIVVTDLDSTNGTFVNGVRVMRAAASPGDVVQIGSTRLRVRSKPIATEIDLPATTAFGRYFGASTEIRRLTPLFQRLAASDVSLIIEGETGTGKEVLAEAIHGESARREEPFVVFDCTAIPANLMEAELFGHEKGAFTGAQGARKGLFEQAAGGTLLIDEIGDLDATLQPKLLRALDRKEIRRLGGDRPIHVDVRVIAATRRDLDKEVAAGRFRDDLFHRLAIGRVELPPLRERRGDVRLLASRFAVELGAAADALPNDVLERWEAHTWPGNVRELRNAVARYLALGVWATETPPPQLPTTTGSPAGTDDIGAILALGLPLTEARRRVNEDFERRYIEDALARHGGNVSRAAAASGVARRHFQHLKAKSKSGEDSDDE
jgi:transcriptional regulator with GAF, ATPase, and Fis domain